ncbi:hypothetical protein TNCT_161361 [Trichonephila clavata]|uniref:Uncharacterized protein n=1 Tax=Trichonephila clavata TaxID=2740835 RepID=A0A8X6FP74_TRICU|nr:hypothetical protein TNCT_161361 [Trichonephila clavata]
MIKGLITASKYALLHTRKYRKVEGNRYETGDDLNYGPILNSVHTCTAPMHIQGICHGTRNALTYDLPVCGTDVESQIG